MQTKGAFSFGAALVVVGTWMCSFLGAVWIIYGMRHNNTLTHYEAAGCALIAFPPTLIVLILLEVLRGR